jgi:hypothetical protein
MHKKSLHKHRTRSRLKPGNASFTVMNSSFNAAHGVPKEAQRTRFIAREAVVILSSAAAACQHLQLGARCVSRAHKGSARAAAVDAGAATSTLAGAVDGRVWIDDQV